MLVLSPSEKSQGMSEGRVTSAWPHVLETASLMLQLAWVRGSTKLVLRSSQVLGNDPDKAVVWLAANEETVKVQVNEGDDHVEFGKETVDLCNALCNSLRK